MSEHAAIFDSIVEDVAAWRAEMSLPGLTFGVHVGGRAYRAGLGVTNVAHPLPVTDETLFQIGSVTKTVTATAMMRLVEQGKLDLGARVRHYLPGFRVQDSAASESVAVGQLLTHVAGWTGDVFTDTGHNDDAAQRYVEAMADFEQLSPLGERFSYNNAAFCVAGRIIERVSDSSYEQAIHDLIFEPLGLAGSTFFARDVLLKRYAVGHSVAESADESAQPLSPWAIPRGMNAAGGIVCDIQDLLRYGAYHLGDGPPLLRRESLQAMHRPHVRINDYMGSVGLAWIMNEIDGQKLLWHNGGTNGQNSVLTIVPGHQLALGMMTNGQTGDALNDRFNKRVLRDFCGIELPEPQVIESSADDLAEFVGRYEGKMREIRLRMDGDALMADIRATGAWPPDLTGPAPPPLTIARCGPDQLVALDGEHENTRADIIRGQDGAIRYLRFGSRLHVKR